MIAATIIVQAVLALAALTLLWAVVVDVLTGIGGRVMTRPHPALFIVGLVLLLGIIVGVAALVMLRVAP